MKISIPGYIHAQRVSEGQSLNLANVIDKHRYDFFLAKDLSSMNYVLVCPYVLEFDVPLNWNPVPNELAILTKAREFVVTEHYKKIAAMDEQISKLQSIEYDGSKT
jgi:hypothetical protein